MFDPVDPRQSLPDLERGILTYWREEDTFKRSLRSLLAQDTEAKREQEEETEFSFYDGPPFATGLPHYGHLLAGTIKDVIPRYQTMKGKHVQRRFGWDCHGLPVEYEVEKEFNLDREKIRAMGVKAFNDLCRSVVLRYTKEWRTTVERMGRWVDMDWDYRTMDPDYMESIWWVFGELYRQGMIKEGYKPMHICPRCVTPLSNFEVTQGYKEITDQSAIVKFRLLDEENTYLLAWTTTPWTLPGNLFLAVNPQIEYVKFQKGTEIYISSKQFADALLAQEKSEEGWQSAGSIDTKSLMGKKYRPLFPYFASEYPDAFRVVAGDFVTTDEGTGVVHIAPGFGEDDFRVGEQEKAKLLQHVTMEGRFIPAVTDFAGWEVKPKDDPTKADLKIIDWLKKSNALFAQKAYKHTYPHCWRCDTPLLNYVTSSWFVTIDEVFRQKMLKNNAKTTWIPAHLRDGRFGNWLENARDWAISRNRYWGTPLPLWRNEETGEIVVLSSRDALMEKVPGRFTKITITRHAESEGNLKPMYQGKAPGTNLTKNGEKQSKDLATIMEKKNVQKIYSSPMARTRQTAEAVSKQVGVAVAYDERLAEIDFGEYEGKSIDFTDLSFVKERRKHRIERNQVESVYHLQGMENWESVENRVLPFIKEILLNHKGEHIMVVTHADPLQHFRRFFTGEDAKKLSDQPYPSFASPYTFYWDHEMNAPLDLHKETVDDVTWSDDNGAFRRIPHVLDCWFESGSMPYAQSHFPFHQNQKSPTKKQKPAGFPADFIAEGVDQTRGWFYTLTVIATALFDSPAFEHCVVNGTVLAEDGKKMSKRLKNYPEPLSVVEKHGADAVRFALMHSQAVRAEDMRFSEKLVEETVRSVLLPLWNAYGFFVTYANAANWNPSATRAKSDHPLDRWMEAEVQDLVNRMTRELDRYDLSATCDELLETIDRLTNWYIRLSRRRFAGKSAVADEEDASDISMERSEERDAALQTLHGVLLTICQVLAPFCPFIAEAIYLNLSGEEHGSVHLSRWPHSHALTKDEHALLQKQRTLRTVVSLGLKIRSSKLIKLRQPLANATVALPDALRNTMALSTDDEDVLRRELNVKTLEFVDDPGSLATPVAQVNARLVGPRLGGRVQDVIQAGKRGEFKVAPDGGVEILGERFTAQEATVVYVAKEGLADVVADHGIVVSMDCAVTPELKKEGEARDLIRAVQKLRKESGLSVDDRIALAVEGADELLQTFGTMIERETNATLGKSNGDAHDVSLDDRTIAIRFST